ncbi:MAG TPA: copper resistance CopC family protein [Candidatus Binatia bacterium]|nr:copper resistance CopC family protein [Candidatus Binatia bacterium]
MDELDAGRVMSKSLFPYLLLLVATAVALPRAVLAHAMPEAEEPKVGSTVTSPPRQVSVRFDAPIEALFSKLDVVDSSGRNETEGTPQVNADTRTLTVPLKPLTPGEYTVKWSVVAKDGHRTEGSYTFSVAGGS